MNTVTIRGTRIAYTDTQPAGRAKGTILALHSLFLDQSIFDPYVVPCVQAGYRFLSYDLRGQGLSSASTESSSEELSITSGADDAAALIEHFDAGPCILFGSSQGAMIALEMSFRRPELVRSVIAVGASAEEEEENQRARFAAALDRIADLGPAAEIETLSWVMLGDTSPRENPEMVRRMRERMCRLPHDIARVARAVIDRPRILEDLRGCHVPVWALGGPEDHTYTPPISTKTIADAIPNGLGKFMEIPGAGHSAVIEQPDQVLEQVLRHLAAVA